MGMNSMGFMFCFSLLLLLVIVDGIDGILMLMLL